MTGDEYWNLKRGSNVTIETPFRYFKKGQVLKVEYIDSLHQQVFLRDTSKELGDQVKIVDTFFILNNFVIGGKLPNKNIEYNLENSFILSKSGTELFSTIDELINSLR